MAMVLIKLTLFTVMFALGLGLQGHALQQFRQRPALFVRTLIGSCLLVPLVALVVLKIPITMGLSESVRFGIGLMALCPSAPLTLRKAGKSGGNRELAALLQVLAVLAAIISIPLLADLFRVVYGIEGWDLRHFDVALQVAIAQVLPLLLGLGVRRWRPQLAGRLLGPLDRLANRLLLLLIVVILIKAAPALAPFAATNLPALGLMAALVAASLAIGWLLAGPDPAESTTVALVTSMRNPGLALLFASLHAPGEPAVKLAILCYLLVTVIVSIPFLRLQKRRAASLPAPVEP